MRRLTSSTVDLAFCDQIGAIPRQHKRLAVLEEFSGAKEDFIKTMTDFRSSNELRLARVLISLYESNCSLMG